jgi:hypothetical protein
MGQTRNAYNVVFSGSLKEKDRPKDLNVDGRITLQWILRK